VLLDCQQGQIEAGWTLQGGERVRFGLKGWRRTIEVLAKRLSPVQLSIELSWSSSAGKTASRSASLGPGETLTVWSHGEPGLTHHGPRSEAFTCTWAE
jgi:hypothetical protein